MKKDRTSPIPGNTTSVKSEDYTNKSLQMDSNPATMEVSKTPAIESSDQTKAAKHEPLVYRVEELPSFWRFLPALRTTCATPRKISGCCASAPASG